MSGLVARSVSFCRISKVIKNCLVVESFGVAVDWRYEYVHLAQCRVLQSLHTLAKKPFGFAKKFHGKLFVARRREKSPDCNQAQLHLVGLVRYGSEYRIELLVKFLFG